MKSVPMPELSDDARRIRDLELALKHERLRSTELQRRNEALEEATKRAYRMALAPGPRRRDED